MTEVPEKGDVAASNPLAKACFIIGGGSLLAAMAIDFVSVVGRHLGFSIVGALELVQYCITGLVASAIVVSTLSNGHVAVHILTERLKPMWRGLLARLSDLLMVCFFLTVLAGDIWIAVELWGRDERSDLLGLPVAPMRALWCVGLALSAALGVIALLGKRKGQQSDVA